MGENLVLEQLRAVRADIQAVREDNRELKARVNEMYSAVLSLRRDQAQDADTVHRVEFAAKCALASQWA